MKRELQRSYETLRKSPLPPYFLSYQLTDNRAISVASSFGSLIQSSDSRTRLLDLDLRVGDYQVDNTHSIEDGNFAQTQYGQFHAPVPLEDDPQVLAVALWLQTDRHYKMAKQRYEAVKTANHMQKPKEDLSPDFSAAPGEKYSEPLAELHFDRAKWEQKIREYGQGFLGNPDMVDASVNAMGELETRRYVNTDGSEIRMSAPLYRLNITAVIKATDGERLPLHRTFMSFSPEGLPSDEEVKKTISEMVDILKKMRSAPVGDAYTGPAILSGRASAVFFHEIFGHRIEGDRLKDDGDAQTFKKKINQPILPVFLSVSSDPEMRKYNKTDLVGYYPFDDEGVKARRVSVVEKGIFKSFLLSRSPMEQFPSSNGHGRRQQGNQVEARQSVLLVQSSTTVSRAALKKMLIERVKASNKPYGLLFDDIEGGFTFTERSIPNSFSIMPTVVYRIYPDGREELIRGLNLIGTPLIAFSKISAADDDTEVFNGVCGARSGWVPVSAIAPGLLVDQIEVQRKEKAQETEPIMADPATDAASSAGSREAR
jgi:predicted Zn-dependent protease